MKLNQKNLIHPQYINIHAQHNSNSNMKHLTLKISDRGIQFFSTKWYDL